MGQPRLAQREHCANREVGSMPMVGAMKHNKAGITSSSIFHVFQPHSIYVNGCIICGRVANVHPATMSSTLISELHEIV